MHHGNTTNARILGRAGRVSWTSNVRRSLSLRYAQVCHTWGCKLIRAVHYRLKVVREPNLAIDRSHHLVLESRVVGEVLVGFLRESHQGISWACAWVGMKILHQWSHSRHYLSN